MGERTTIVCRTDAGVPTDVREAVRALARWLRLTQDIRHRLSVRVVPGDVAVFTRHRDPDARFFGAFLRPTASPRRYRETIRIYVAGQAGEAMETKHSYTRQQGVFFVLWTILHEFAHYEEWRDGKRPNEKRANARATALIQQAYGAKLETADAASRSPSHTTKREEP